MPEPTPTRGSDSRTFEDGKFSRFARERANVAYFERSTTGGRRFWLAGKGDPSPPVDFPENEAHKWLKNKQKCSKNRLKRS